MKNPENWLPTTLSELADINPRKPSKNDFAAQTSVTFVPMTAVDAECGEITEYQTRSFEEVLKGYTAFKENDVLFAKITPCMENGKSAIAKKLKNGVGFGSTEFHVFRSFGAIDSSFLFYFIRQARFRKESQANMTGSAGQKRVPTNFLKSYKILLPPLPEQQRIVAKIEELFSDLDDGIASLRKAQAQLKIYRQAVLKYAFEGKLTAEWRESRAKTPRREEKNLEKNLCAFAPLRENPKALLEHIKEEREHRYAKQLEEWKQAVNAWEAGGKPGKKPAKPRKPKDLPPLTADELAELPELPEGWCWTRLAEISVAFGGYAFKSKEFKTSGIYQVIKIANVKMGQFPLESNPAFVENVSPEIVYKYGLKRGDCVITLTGTRKKRDYGFVAMVKGHQNLLLNQRLAAIRFFNPIVPEYFQYALQGEHFQNSFFKHETGNVGQGNVGMKAITEEAIALPPVSEQQQIVAGIESRLSVCDKLEQTIEESLQKSEALRQSILKKAFEGKLVPQDPNDEPAEKLLERIKNSRKDAKPQRKNNQR